MKTTISFIAILALASITDVHAQQPVKPTQDPVVQQQRSAEKASRAEQRSTKMAGELGLNEEQTAKMKEIDARYTDALEMVRSTTTDRQEIQTKNEVLRRQHEAELKFMLTPEQYTKMQELRTADRKEALQRREEMQQKRAAE